MLSNRGPASAPAGASAIAERADRAKAAAHNLSMRRRLRRMGKETLIAVAEPFAMGAESDGSRAAEHGIARRISGKTRTAALRGRRRLAVAFPIRARRRPNATLARTL